MRFFLPMVIAAQLVAAVDARGDNKDVARSAFAEGQRRYDLNEFGPALEAFKRAYLAYEEPAFLFNIAQCYRQLGDKSEAIKFYRSYLRKVPDAQNRDDVKSLVASLEAEVAAAKAATPAVSPPSVPSPAAVPAAAMPATTSPTSSAATSSTVVAKHKPLYKRWWLWTIVGVAAAGAATGVAVALTSQRTESSFTPVTVTP